ncbi:General odorant-binding protein 99b [Pseudolycoriella hygida]|uniref:General odorant-binding protein 99b n=1 Tax=Pseudolycoriella hygida TaxID=35572 RepID=A0A9Q0S2L1_9DIPT|nr:General odorant-binding protein 99b [Pseudolycoriella hygida]
MRHLVLLIVFVTGTIASYQETTMQQFADYRIQCSEANGISREELLQILKHPFPSEGYPQCYVKCILEMTDFLDNNNELVAHKIIHQLNFGEKNLNVELLENAVEECNERFRSEPVECTKAYNTGDCFFRIEQRFSIFIASLNRRAL